MSDKALCMIPHCFHSATATIRYCAAVCERLGYKDAVKFEEEVCDAHGALYVDHCKQKPACALGPRAVKA